MEQGGRHGHIPLGLDEDTRLFDHVRPHQGPGYLTPVRFLSQWMVENDLMGLVSTMY